MCSIPGLPTPGSEVPVLISRVELNPDCGFVKLWVNLYAGGKHGYERMKEEIQTPKRKFCGSEGKPGDPCLVRIGDAWHRSRIVSVQGDTCSVFLVDQGKPHVATRAALAWGPSDSFVLPPEIETCILANVLSLNSAKVVKFLKSLPGKSFRGLVQHVLMPDRTILLDIPTVSKHMWRLQVAKKIPTDEFKCLVLKCLQLAKGDAFEGNLVTPEQYRNVSCQMEGHDHYFYPELLDHALETVEVTEVTDPQSIFCKLHIFSKAVRILSEQIHQHYEETPDFGEAKPQMCGDPCAARGASGRWRRSLLKQNIVTSDGAVKVLHVDEGKTESVPVGDIRPLHGKFLRMPVFTYLCSLDGIDDDGARWTINQTDCLKSMILNKTVVVMINRHDISQDVYYVTLYSESATCVNDYFLEKAGLLLPSKTGQRSNVQNEPIPSSFLSSLDHEQCVGFPEKDAYPSTKNLHVNGREDDVSGSGPNPVDAIKDSEYSDPPSDNDGHRLKCCPSEVLGVHQDDALPVGSTVPVTASCIPPPVSPDAYNYSTHDIEVGGSEKMWVTSSVSVSHFYCQLERNSHLFDRVHETVEQLVCQTECTDGPFELIRVCLARYSDNQWRRGQVVEMAAKPKVHFVDYGDTLEVNESNIRPLLADASIAGSVPVLAVPLGLLDVPAEVPQEVNQWFADLAVGRPFTMSVVAEGDGRKLIVELFDGSRNVNGMVREKMAKMEGQKVTGSVQQTQQKFSEDSQRAGVQDEDIAAEELMSTPPLTKTTEQHELNSKDATCAGETHEMNSQAKALVALIEERGKTLEEATKTPLDVDLKNGTVLAETFIQSGHTESEIPQLHPATFLKGVGSSSVFKNPNIHLNKTEDVYASCIAGPHYFWCQPANSEILNTVTMLAQEAGQTQNHTMFPMTLDPGSSCLALFSSDNQWYRAKVISRSNNTLQVVFIDYGNESEVEIKDVRSLPESLLEQAPQAFLCYLSGFDESSGCWDDDVYDQFYHLLVDKLLKVTTFSVGIQSAISVTQYNVKIDLDGVIVNDMMQKYWKPFSLEHEKKETVQTTSNPNPQVIQSESNIKHLKENVKSCLYKKPNVSKHKTEVAYVSCVVEPHFFWCQFDSAEVLNKMSRLAQEAGQTEQDLMFPETLVPGNPCLALFSSDNQWYRAQVVRRGGNKVHVVFIDYGNETDVEIKNVRSLPPSLLEQAPQAFLCSLNGFDASRGSWDDKVYDDFYSLLVDKPLRVATLFNMEDHPDIAVPRYAVEVECEGVLVNTAMQKYWKPVAKERITKQNSQPESDITLTNLPKVNVSTCMYKQPKVPRNKTVMAYASCIAEPKFFWCQYANTEDLCKVSRLVQEAGQREQDPMLPETLGPGSPCLALFSSDNRWYRAQVMSRTGDTFQVVFIDYGNESEVDLKDVRAIPLGLLEQAPQAFLCSLSGFDESKGFWNDEVYDDFYSLLVDRPLEVSVIKAEDHSEFLVPQYTVDVECEGVPVNAAMEKYWNGNDKP